MVAALFMLPVAALGSSADGERDWTVLMYFGADNDLYQATEFGMNQALKGLAEAKADKSELAVVVLIDGPKNGDTCVYELTKDGKVQVSTQTVFGNGDAEKKMTDPETLYKFVTWAMPAYPAEKTMLVLKNGHAWCGICPDETDNSGDETILMPIEGVRNALASAKTDNNLWIDAVVFDGDNMGSFEVAYELRQVTDYFVGSQQQVPLEGLPYYLFLKNLAGGTSVSVEEACKQMTKDYVTYYNNTKGNKPLYDKLLANSQMYVTAAAFRMGDGGKNIEAVKDAFDAFLNYMLYGEVDVTIKEELERLGIDTAAKLDQWYYPDAEGVREWSWIPLNRNNISSSRDKALIGKMNDQQGYEWLPDAYTWLWSMSALTNYDAYLDPVPPSGDVNLSKLPTLDKLKDPFVRVLLEDFMGAFGYVEPGIYRGVWNYTNLSPGGALVWVSQSQLLDRSGNSFPHGLNIWFPPSWLQWDEDDAWSDLFTKEMTYAYSGIGVWLGTIDEPILMPAEYYCIDCPDMYDEIGLDFTQDTSWMDFFEVYYDSRWLIYGGDTGSRADNKP